MNRRVFLLFFACAYLFSLYLYAPNVDFYFFQDDFFEINISKAGSFREYLSFFNFRDDIIAYRPISLQNYFFASQNLFDLDPVGFRLITFILFFANGFLITWFISKICKSNLVGILAAVLWLTSSIHFMSLTWIAAAYNIIGTFFWLLTSFFAHMFTKSEKPIFFAATFLTFLITVGSYEFSVTWPVIFGLYYFLVLKNSLWRTAKLFSPFMIIALVYIGARFLLIKIPQITEYQAVLNLDSAKAFFWYILWTFNIPEELKKQVVSSLVSLNPIFLAEFWTLTVKSFTSFLWVMILAVAVPLSLAVKKEIKLDIKLIFFFLVFFSLAISPVLVLPNHTFSMYLTLASIGIYALVAYLLTLTRSKFLVTSVLLIWIFSSATTINFYRHNYWMIEAQKAAKKTMLDLKSQFPTLTPNSTVFYYLPYSWQWQALSYQEAIKTVYNDPSLSIYYNKEALKEAYKKSPDRPVYIYLPP